MPIIMPKLPSALIFFLLLLTSSVDPVVAQRPHRQSRIEQVGAPEQVSEHRTRYHTTGEIEFALLDADAELDGVEEDDFELVLRDGTSLKFEGLDLHDNEQEPDFKYWTKENDDMSSILLVFTDSAFGSKDVRGIIQNVTNGMTYEFTGEVVDGTLLSGFDIDEVVQYDPEFDPQMRDEASMVGDMDAPEVLIDGVDDPPDGTEASESRALAQLRGSVIGDGRRLQMDDSGSVLDVMVVVTRRAMCAIARTSSGCRSSARYMREVESHMNTAVANTNEAYRESGINSRLRMVHFYVDNNIDETRSDWNSVLSTFSDNPSVVQQRNKYGADFAALIINKGQYCGIGWKPPKQSDIHEFLGYSVTQWDCATGYLSFAHEIAHNMGCNHDRNNSPKPTPAGAYNYGYQDPARQFRSVMAYSCGSPCTRIRRFSGDRSWTDNGKRVGNASGENNAKWIRQNLSTYGKFRTMAVPLTPSGSPTPKPFPNPTPPPTPSPTPGPTPGQQSVNTPNPTPSPTPAPKSVKKTMEANMKGGRTGGDGNMFDLKAKQDLRITNFGLHTDTAAFCRVEIYKRKKTGSFVGDQFDEKKWKLIGSAEFDGLGPKKVTKLPEGSFSPIVIEKGKTQAIYISFRRETSNNMYSPGRQVGRLYSSDANLEFFEGIAIHYPFGGRWKNQWSPRVWNGIIDYELGTFGSDTTTTLGIPSPTSAPSVLAPTLETPAPTTNDRSIGTTQSPQQVSIPNEPVRTETTFEGGNGQAGNMFVLHSTAENPVLVNAFEFHTFSIEELKVVVYTMEGSFELKPGSDQDESRWAKIADTTVVGAGSPNPTLIPTEDVFAPVTIPPGKNQSFYISLEETKMRYTTGVLDETEQTGLIRMVASVGKEYFFARSFTPRIWNGAFYWKEVKGGGGEVASDVPSGYTLSWRDDFNKPDLDTTNWSRGLVYDKDKTKHVLWNKNEGGPHILNAKYHGYILDEDAYIKDGKLVLANREHKPALVMQEGQFQYSTGWINSLHKRFFNGSKKGVYLEVRARFPEGPKVWPAIWLVSERPTWPPEIDIWEYFGVFYKPEWGIDEMHLRNIWGEWPNKKTHNIEVPFHVGGYSGFRTFGWLWTSQRMTWYIDGVEIATKVKGADIPVEGWPDEDMCLILNNGLMSEVNANLEVEGVTTTFPNYLEVDYIAIHEGTGGGGEPPRKPGEYLVVLGEAGESCSSACSRSGAQCTLQSLVHGDTLTTSSKIADTASSAGTSCNFLHAEKDWDVNPQVSSENYCYPTPVNGRSNQDCNAESTLKDKEGNLQGHRICSCEKTAEYVTLLGGAGESCTSTCSQEGAKCTVKSLLYGDALATSSKIEGTADSVGGSCSGGMHKEKDWDVNPQISSENYCYPTPQSGRTNQDCDAASTLEDDDGNLQGHRICTCEKSEGGGPVGGGPSEGESPTVAPTPAPAIPRFHTTTYENGNGANGNMFNIKAKNDLTITNVHIHTNRKRGKTVDVEIYALKEPNKSFEDYVSDENSWELIGEARDVEGQGTGNPTMLPENSIKKPMEVKAGQIQALYVSVVGGGLRYTNGDKESQVEHPLYNDSEDLEFYEGVGVAGSGFKNVRVFAPRVFNGIFEFVVQSASAQDGVSTMDEGKSLVEVMEDASYSYPPGEKGEGWPCASDKECASNQCGAENEVGTDVEATNMYIDGVNPPPDLDDYDTGARRRQMQESSWCLDEDGVHDEDAVED